MFTLLGKKIESLLTWASNWKDIYKLLKNVWNIY